MTSLLPYLLTTLQKIKFENISLSYKQNLRTVFNTLTAGRKYSLFSRFNLTQSIQMQLSLNGKTFDQFFSEM